VLVAAAGRLVVADATAAAGGGGAIVVDYPAEGSIFPPDMEAPTFLWRDPATKAATWRVEVTFADGSSALEATSAGEPMRLGELDPRAIGPTNEPPKLTPEQAAAHTWKPDAAAWAAIKAHSVGAPATVTFSGADPARPGEALSRGQVRIETSSDPVGAPIFYRDVPLMPSAGRTGVIQPLATDKVSLIAWRLRSVSEPASRVLLTGMHTCANCHSFSRDGRTLGMDLDGPKNDKGVYALTAVQPQTTIRNQDVIAWSSFRSKLGNQLRVGFMSQVSPDGRRVVTTIKPRVSAEDAAAAGRPLSRQQLLPLYYVSNFPTYRFLQVFYPTGGILVWYDRASGELRPLPGADDPRYVQANATWSPDGRSLVFCRAEARDPHPPGRPLATFANDPNEVQVQYDLYRIPFDDGRGGTPEPIRGASANGMSNSFPKISPDGRFIVYVQAKNGLLMRPDSQLYIVPVEGGTPRRMRCNTPLMNSWHSFSPNGRWLVFSSKSRSPYTQLFLTHVDENGNDSPAILIENSTAANRAVNIPEFVNVPYDGFQKILTPAADFYQQFNLASELTERGKWAAAVLAWKKAMLLNDADDRAHNSYAVALASSGRLEEAIPHFERAIALNPEYDEAQNSFGTALMSAGRIDEAIPHFERAIALNGENAESQSNLGVALAHEGRLEPALAHLERAVALDPDYLGAQANLGGALMQKGELSRAIPHFEKAVALDGSSAALRTSLGFALLSEGRGDDAYLQFVKAADIDPRSVAAHEGLGSVQYYVRGNTREALAQWRRVLQLQPDHVPVMVQAAWALATSKDPALRGGQEALTLAGRAVRASGSREPTALDALAAAYAELGRFGAAARTAEQALARAREQGNAELAQAVSARLALYQDKKPFRERF
jgi:tetratricopeptide (TPR) repeat protein